jgi:hypothetical protein
MAGAPAHDPVVNVWDVEL